MTTIVQYTRKDFNSEWSTHFHVINVKSVPNLKGRNDLDIHYWIEQFPKSNSVPDGPPNRTEERGNDWTSHILEYWDVE